MTEHRIELDEHAPGLNQLLRMHFRERKRLLERWVWMLRSKGVPERPLAGPLRVVYLRRTPRTLMDWDNAAGSFKLVGDALVRSGWLVDDNPAVIAEFLPRQERGPASTVLTIWPANARDVIPLAARP